MLRSRLYSSLASLWLCGVVVGQTPADCVSAELVSGLLSNGRTSPSVLMGVLPESFPKLQLPDDARLVGSAVFDRHGRVVVASTMPVDGARQSLAVTLGDAGWYKLAVREPARGFVNPGAYGPTVLCHPELGSLNMWVVAAGSGSVFTLSHSHDSGRCEAGTVKGTFLLEADFPYLRNPFGATVKGESESGSGSGSSLGDSSERSLVLASDGTMKEIREHYSAQLQDQAWISDGQSESTRSVGSTWWRRTKKGTYIYGALGVTQLDDRTVEVFFRIVRGVAR